MRRAVGALPTYEYGKHTILRDTRAEVDHHDNHVFVGEVMYFLEVTHNSPSVPDLTLAVCRRHAPERMVIGDDERMADDEHDSGAKLGDLVHEEDYMDADVQGL
eukprot:jgi/Tetstr1/456527/TSEL_043249.t1